ncbi:hypothetical protein ADK34_39615 [Streptomyces viridochromogenes]|uniref:Uncharacterized protein n=1 Tax=Streptomyces viridochromogenes TaxID=1938 RepID=A0A0L8J2X6_STRVR|nr:hypothetical protein ADK34_39615 [Streptomyces viridochromogenes]
MCPSLPPATSSRGDPGWTDVHEDPVVVSAAEVRGCLWVVRALSVEGVGGASGAGETAAGVPALAAGVAAGSVGWKSARVMSPARS